MPEDVVGSFCRPHGDYGHAQMLQAVHRLGSVVGDVAAEGIGGRNLRLGHGVGEDGVNVPLSGQPVGGLGHIAGGVDVRDRCAQMVVDVDPPFGGDLRASR